HKRNQIIDYSTILRDAINQLQKENSFLGVEKASADYLINVLKQAKYLSFGPEPVLAYYYAKVNEINLVRMVILGKLNDVPGITLKERLNEVYA
ncbi:MAG: V-type ATPase subunit, partial [Candidatus Omnitrophica bacterium]|nr:V-type ATPase subunit [Candidatus Omnitrophota bacterium]